MKSLLRKSLHKMEREEQEEVAKLVRLQQEWDRPAQWVQKEAVQKPRKHLKSKRKDTSHKDGVSRQSREIICSAINSLQWSSEQYQ